MHSDCQKIRELIIDAAHQSGHGHIPTCFSIVEMLYATYQNMNYRPEQPDWTERDIFILSKGHGALGYYCVLSHLGYLPESELKTFGAYQSRLGCHADRYKVPGVEASTGSLGHGIGLAVGMALAFKIQKNARQVFILIGDGESNEGSVWEAVMAASDQKLNNLTILYDNNQSQLRCMQIPNPVERFKSFGCQVIEVDGHSIGALNEALKTPADQVRVLVCNTQKGFGSQTLVDDMFAWHRRSPNAEELAQLREEIYA